MAIDLFQADELVSRANVNQRLTDVTTKFTSVDTNITNLTPVQLYYNTNGSTGTIELSDNIKNYQMIEICFWVYTLSAAWNHSVRLHNGGTNSIGTALTISIGGNYNSTPRLKAYGGNTWAVDDQITRSGQTRMHSTGTNSTATDNVSTASDCPTIYRVIGYKNV